MKILYVTEFFSDTTGGEITGGVEARVFYLKKYLEKAGHSVSIMSRAATTFVGGTSVLTTLIKWPNFVLKTLREGNKHHYDVVVGQSFVCYPIAWLVGRINNVPVIYCYHDSFIGSWIKNIGPGGVIGEILERIDLILMPKIFIAVSQSTKNKLIDQGISPTMIKVVYNGIDEPEISSITSTRKKYDICSVARLVSYKRIDILIEAVFQLIRKFPEIQVMIIGKGIEEANLKSLVQKLHLEENIFFLGHFDSHSDVLKKVKSAKVFCLPSITEGFGISVVEAAGLGIPLVLSNIPALSEVTNGGKGGFLFEAENSRELARRISQLLENRNLYQKKSREAKNLARKFFWKNLAEEEIKIYQQVVNKK